MLDFKPLPERWHLSKCILFCGFTWMLRGHKECLVFLFQCHPFHRQPFNLHSPMFSYCVFLLRFLLQKWPLQSNFTDSWFSFFVEIVAGFSLNWNVSFPGLEEGKRRFSPCITVPYMYLNTCRLKMTHSEIWQMSCWDFHY